jgi:16S rRNA pseudouridine516 synthase
MLLLAGFASPASISLFDPLRQLACPLEILAHMQLQDILFSQGFGTRRVCAGLVQHGHVTVAGERLVDATAELSAPGLRFSVDGVEWEYHEKAYLMLHKPAGMECSRKPSAYPSIYTLLPPPLRQRPQKAGVQGVQAVGRLDQDTTGLLLLTDDGQFIHRMSSPRRHVPKNYEVEVRHPLADRQIERLLEGVVLEDDPRPVRAAACARMGERQLRLILTEGKYHQVKRMIAAVGNRVEALHRSQIGSLALPPDLLPGQWRWLGTSELDALQQFMDPRQTRDDNLTAKAPGTRQCAGA